MIFSVGLRNSSRTMKISYRLVAPYRPDWASKIGRETKIKFPRSGSRVTAKIDRSKWSDWSDSKGKISSPSPTQRERVSDKQTKPKSYHEITTFHDVSFILIDFEAIEGHVCEFPAIHVKNGEILSIFHSYCRESHNCQTFKLLSASPSQRVKFLRSSTRYEIFQVKFFHLVSSRVI